MIRLSIGEKLARRGIDDPAIAAVADEADWLIECLESRLAELESRLLTAKITIARLVEASGLGAVVNHGMACPICGALGDESCDAGLHG